MTGTTRHERSEVSDLPSGPPPSCAGSRSVLHPANRTDRANRPRVMSTGRAACRGRGSRTASIRPPA